MTKYYPLLILGVLMLVFATFAALLTVRPSYNRYNSGVVACTADARLCPDGSSVGRSGPLCEFAPCPRVNTVSTSTQNSQDELPPPTPLPLRIGGISGEILIGPICAVARVPADPKCSDRPYQTSMQIIDLQQSKVVGQFTSDTFGKFKVELPAGKYRIDDLKGAPIYPRCGSADSITVKSGIFTNITLNCDTGIR